MYKIKIVIIAHITMVSALLSNKRNSSADKDYNEISHLRKDCNYLY